MIHYCGEYPLILRLVVIALLVPADTSECERIFSLMNELKTADRSRMSQQNLRNIMLWYSMAKDLKPQELPVLAILKKFRELSGVRGHKSHRPAPRIEYDYEKQIEA